MGMGSLCCRESAFHIRTHSRQAAATVLPSDENETTRTGSALVRDVAVANPVAAFQRLTMTLPPSAVTSRPAGPNAKETRLERCKTAAHCRALRSQIRMVLS